MTKLKGDQKTNHLRPPFENHPSHHPPPQSSLKTAMLGKYHKPPSPASPFLRARFGDLKGRSLQGPFLWAHVGWDKKQILKEAKHSWPTKWAFWGALRTPILRLPLFSSFFPGASAAKSRGFPHRRRSRFGRRTRARGGAQRLGRNRPKILYTRGSQKGRV